MNVLQSGWWLVLVLACGCGPFTVRHGPESCSVAETWESSFGPPGRGNTFRFRRDMAEVGLISQEGRSMSLRTLWTVHGDVNGQVLRGATLGIALGGEVLEIPVGQTAAPVSRIHSTQITRPEILTSWTVLGRVDDETLEALTSAPVEALQIDLPNGRRQMTLSADVGARLQTLAICLAGGYPIE